MPLAQEPEGPPAERISITMYSPDAEDPLVKQRGRCLESDCEVKKYFKVLKECDARVMKKIRYTAENCSQEMVDLIHALDHCVKDIAFHKLV